MLQIYVNLVLNRLSPKKFNTTNVSLTHRSSLNKVIRLDLLIFVLGRANIVSHHKMTFGLALTKSTSFFRFVSQRLISQ